MNKLFKHFCFVFVLFASIAFPQWQQTVGPFDMPCFTLTAGNGSVFATGLKIHRSDDNGMTWTEKMNGIGIVQNSFEEIFIAGSRIFVIATKSPQSFLYYSDNNGESWTSIISPTVSGGSLESITKCGDKLFLCTYYNGIHVSTDNGATWSKIQSNLPDNSSLRKLASINGVLFVASNTGVYKSTNDGITWTLCPNPPNLQEASKVYSNNGILYALYRYSSNSLFVYRSLDLGASFEQLSVNDSLMAYNIFSEGNNIYAWTVSGAYRSTNNGISWTLASNNGEGYYCITSSGNNLIIGTWEFGVFTSTDNGISWINTGCHPDNSAKVLFASDTTLICSEGGLNYLIISRDHGNSFKDISNLAHISEKSIYKRNNDFFAAANGNFLKSSDNAKTWKKVGIINNSITSFTHYNNYFFAGSYSDGVFKSTDDGITWTQINTGLNATLITSLMILDSTLYAGTNNGIFKTTNKGVDWVSAGLENIQVNSLTVLGTTLYAATNNGLKYLDLLGSWINTSLFEYVGIIKSKNNYLIAAVDVGLKVSNDFGNSWKVINNNSINTRVLNLLMDDKYIYATISNKGIWKAPLSILTDVNESNIFTPIGYVLNQNYPNPFNPVTTISFSLPKHTNVKLSIFDILGKEVEVLIEKEITAGLHEVNFDGSMLNSGVYFYRLQTDEFTETRKLILMK